MPKLKSNRGAAKRFRPTGGKGKGGFKCKRAGVRHQMSCKSTKVKRHKRAGLDVRDEDLGRIVQMLPYAG
jgi:large subunit ribosomal protein L35